MIMGNGYDKNFISPNEIWDMIGKDRAIYPPVSSAPLPPEQRGFNDPIKYMGDLIAKADAQSRFLGFIPLGCLNEFQFSFTKKLNNHFFKSRSKSEKTSVAERDFNSPLS